MAEHPSSTSARGRHFLRSRALAEQFVRSTGIDPGHLVWEVGAGTGLVTAELASRARAVRAIEVDRRLAERLRERFADHDHVEIVHGDALGDPLPNEAFRVVANVPFAVTTALLHKLLDSPEQPLLRADLIVQAQAAHKRVRGRNLLNAAWGPWYTFAYLRTLPRTCFRPPPSVDAAILVIERRRDPLLKADEHDGYVRLLRTAFTPSCGPLRRELPAAVRGHPAVPGNARAIDLDVEAWVGLYRALSGTLTPVPRRRRGGVR